MGERPRIWIHDLESGRMEPAEEVVVVSLTTERLALWLAAAVVLLTAAVTGRSAVDFLIHLVLMGAGAVAAVHLIAVLRALLRKARR